MEVHEISYGFNSNVGNLREYYGIFRIMHNYTQNGMQLFMTSNIKLPYPPHPEKYVTLQIFMTSDIYNTQMLKVVLIS